MSSAAALRASIYAALKNDAPLAALLGGAKIYDEPPRDALLPYVTLGEDVVADASTATEPGDEHALTLHVWSRQGGHREAHVIAGAVLEALAEAPLELDGHHLANLRFVALLLKANFNPNQPRAPAGSPDGGQWTRVGGLVSEPEENDGASSGGPLRITVRPDGVAPDIESLFDLPPAIPGRRPGARQEENRVARAAIRWLARAVLRQTLGPAGTYLTIIEAASWLHEHLPNMQSYLDSPKSLGELRDAVREPKMGYDIHHIVEQGPAAVYGFPRSMIDAPENLVRIPRYKHWEINAWYGSPNRNFGGISPREYLEDKEWAERAKVGMDALIEAGVLKP